MKMNKITENIGMKGFPVTQNGQDFIIGKATIGEILKYTKYTERLIVGYDEEEKPIYNNQIQRKVDDARTNKIADFLINDSTATFPTNLVLGIPSMAIKSQLSKNGIIEIIFNDFVAENIQKLKDGDNQADVYITIIDGQHRVAGIEKAISRLSKLISQSPEIEAKKYKRKLDDLMNIELVISCFIDKSLEYQAMIFSTINRTQKRVSQDLVHSLFGITENDSPFKTALEVTLALNGNYSSPFYKRIKLYGDSYDSSSFIPPLSQSTMIKKIVTFISISLREAENDRFRKRSELKGETKKNLPFRKYYSHNEDIEIARCLKYYFSSIQLFFPELWEYNTQKKPTNVLQSTVGFDALMNLLKDILERQKDMIFAKGCFDKYIEVISNLPLGDIKAFPMTTKGKKILYNSMFIKLFPNDASIEEKQKELESLHNAD